MDKSAAGQLPFRTVFTTVFFFFLTLSLCCLPRVRRHCLGNLLLFLFQVSIAL